MADDREYWEMVRDWMKHPNITRQSLKVPCLEDLKQEKDLYWYLKDGTELCRLCRLLPEGVAMQKGSRLSITYRTNNVKSLEEANIKEFLEVTDDIRDLRGMFGDEGQTVFRNYEDFGRVLDGLARFSAYVEENTQVDKIDIKRGNKSFKKSKQNRKAIKLMVEKETVVDSIYDNAGQTSEEISRASQVYNDYVLGGEEEEESSNLAKAITEICDVHSRYIIQLKILKEGFKDLATHHLLTKAFDLTNLDALLNCHQPIVEEFELLKINYREIGRIFHKLYDPFLVAYAEYASIQQKVCEFIQIKKDYNKELIQEVNDLENGVRLENKMLDLQSLLMLPTQHVMRYPMMLENIEAMARKEERCKLESEARKAKELMDTMVHFINKYQQESSYSETMKALQKKIREFNLDLNAFGPLKREPEVEVRTLDETQFRSGRILCFEQTIIFIDITKESQFCGHNLLGRTKEIIHKVERFSGKMFKIQNYEDLYKVQAENYYLVRANDIDQTLNIIEEKSFELKFQQENEADDMLKMLIDLRENAKKKIESGEVHNDHKFKKYKQIDGNSLQNLKKCGLCNKYLPGKFQIGIKCCTCNKVYHTDCFKQDNGKEEENGDTFSVINDYQPPMDQKIIVTNKEDFCMDPEVMGRTKATDLLLKKRCGTFLFRKNEKNKIVLSRRVRKDEAKSKSRENHVHHHIIEQREFKKSTFFWIRKGESFTNFVDLVNYYSEDYFLLYPIHLEDSNLSDGCNSDDEINNSDYIEAPHMPYTSYLFSCTSADQASSLLKSEKEGTFLIRTTETNDFRISKKGKKGVKHSILYQDRSGNYYINKKTKFATIEDLIHHYRGLGSDEEGWLHNPLINPEVEKKWASSSSDNYSQNIQDYTKLPYYHGFMTSTDAHNLLNASRPDSFLLRDNEEGMPRISFQKDHEIKHVVINQMNNSFFVSPERLFSSIENLVNQLIEDLVLKIPLNVDKSPVTLGEKFSIFKTKGNTPKRCPPETPKNRECSNDRVKLRTPYITLTAVQAFKIKPKTKIFERLESPEAAYMLKDEPDGKWLLRSAKGGYRITYKVTGAVNHMVIRQTDQGFYTMTQLYDQTPKPLDQIMENVLLEGLVDPSMEHKEDNRRSY